MNISEEKIIYLSPDDLIDFTPEAGCIYANLPNEIYHSLTDWIGSSQLKNAQRSMEYYHWKLSQPSTASASLEKGSALHTAMESLTTVDDLSLFNAYVKTFDGKQIPSAKWEKAKAENPGCYVISKESFDDVKIMAEKTFKICSKYGFFEIGYPELSIFWIDKLTGLKCKCRPDWLKIKNKIVFDYKTTTEHNPKEFAKSIANFGYHISSSFYLRGLSHVFGEEFNDFVFIVINSTPPYEIAFYSLKDMSRKEGDFQVESLLLKIKQNQQEILLEEIELPFWAITQFDKQY